MSFYSTYICLTGLYNPDLVSYEELTDDDDEDEYDSQTNGYCGFAQNFLDKRVSKHLSALPRNKSKSITPEVKLLYMKYAYSTDALKSYLLMFILLGGCKKCKRTCS